MFGIGDTQDEAVAALARTLRDGLRGKAGAQRGFAADRFSRIVLLRASEFELDELGE